MQTEIVDSIAKNRFLNKKDITSCFLDFLAHVEQIRPFLLENFVHLSVVVDNNLIFHLH